MPVTCSYWTNHVLVLLFVKRLLHAFKKLVTFVRDKEYIVGILAGLHYRVNQLLVARPSRLFAVVVVLLCQGRPSRWSVFRCVFRPLAFELIDDIVGGTGSGRKQYSPEILSCLFPCSLSNCVEGGGITDAQNIPQLGLALKHVKGSFAGKRKPVLSIVLVLGEDSFTLAGEYRPEFHRCLSIA